MVAVRHSSAFIRSSFRRWVFGCVSAPLVAAFHGSKRLYQAHLVTTLTDDKVLVGIGPGGAIAVGMVANAIRVLGYEPPSVIVVDHRYEVLGSVPRIATLVPSDFRLPAEKCWIIQGHIGTGRSLQKLKEQLSLERAHVLAFVISSAAELREKVDVALMVGSRNVLPWPPAMPGVRG